MRKYENIDIVAALGAVVELNTEFYKSDYRYDVETFREAAKRLDGDNNRLLWMSRQSGTWCFPERDVYIKGTGAFCTWNGYATVIGDVNSYLSTIAVHDRILAFAVHIKGFEHNRIKGDIYELDYRDHIRKLNLAALPLHTVTAKYEDGAVMTLPHAEHDAKRKRLFYQHGNLVSYRGNPEDGDALLDILKNVRDQRERDATPAIFKVRVKNPEQPSIKEMLSAGKKQLDRQRVAAPTRAVKTKKYELGD